MRCRRQASCPIIRLRDTENSVTRPGAILVTGASGFIGRRLVQLLNEQNYRVRALVRQLPQPKPDAPTEFIVGDLTRPETYASALSGTWAVVHTALTERSPDDVSASKTLESLSAQQGVQKFIHLSSIAVYGNPPEGIITEETPPILRPDAYSRTKLAIEEALRLNRKTPEVAILRLGCVYGPGGGWWSDSLLNMMERGKVILVDGGTGTANLIHVADVAALVLLLLQRSNPPWDVFNVTDGMPVQWSRYFSTLEQLLGRAATVSMTSAEAQKYARKWLRPSLLRRVIRKLTHTGVIHPLDESGIEGFLSRAVYTNQKAVRVLAFRPRYDLKSGAESVRLDRGPLRKLPVS